MSYQERIEGAKLIEEKIREKFSLAGKNVDGIKWNISRGGQLTNFSSHTAYIVVEGRKLTLSDIPNDRVEGYPGGAGNEMLDACIQQLVNQ